MNMNRWQISVAEHEKRGTFSQVYETWEESVFLENVLKLLRIHAFVLKMGVSETFNDKQDVLIS